MSVVTFASTLTEDGSFTVPQEAGKVLGVHPGDEFQVRIETLVRSDQTMLQERAAMLFEQADNRIRVPGSPLTDPYDAAWATGVEEKARRIH